MSEPANLPDYQSVQRSDFFQKLWPIISVAVVDAQSGTAEQKAEIIASLTHSLGGALAMLTYGDQQAMSYFVEAAIHQVETTASDMQLVAQLTNPDPEQLLRSGEGDAA